VLPSSTFRCFHPGNVTSLNPIQPCTFQRIPGVQNRIIALNAARDPLLLGTGEEATFQLEVPSEQLQALLAAGFTRSAIACFQICTD
jgi:hypothetical protein